MKYYNKDNVEITGDEWETLAGKPSYWLIMKTRDEFVKIQTSWIGIDNERFQVTVETPKSRAEYSVQFQSQAISIHREQVKKRMPEKILETYF